MKIEIAIFNFCTLYRARDPKVTFDSCQCDLMGVAFQLIGFGDTGIFSKDERISFLHFGPDVII